jgi:predicted aspartyl protease
MRFAYLQVAVSAPVISLDGRMNRPRPAVHIALVGPTGTRAIEALLDTGSDDTVFPESEALRAGIDLSQAVPRQLQGIGTAGQQVRFVEVTLRLTDGIERREWTAWVGFTPFPLRRGLLGFSGFLRFFKATFDGEAEVVELETNGLYLGS